jgi:hypothetical protein
MNKYELVDTIETGFNTLKTTEVIASETILDAISKKLEKYELFYGKDKFLKEKSEEICKYRKKVKAEKTKRERQ